MDFTMKKPNERNSIHEAAKKAIDEDDLARVLELAGGEECGHDAVKALQEVTAEEIVADALGAAAHARRRGRELTGEDIGGAVDERRSCCSQQQTVHSSYQRLIKVER